MENLLWAFFLRWPFVLGCSALLIIGRFDLSAGGIAALVAVVVITLLVKVGIFGALIGGLLVALISASVFWLFTVRLRGNILLCGFGLEFVGRGVALLISDGSVVSAERRIVPLSSVYSGSGELGPLLVLSGCLAAVFLFQRLGHSWLPIRRIVQLGQSEQALGLFGISLWRYRAAVYWVNGALVGVGGCLAALNVGAGSARMHPDIALESIAASVLGGLSLKGGHYRIAGPALGLFALVAIEASLVFAGLSLYWRPVVFGLVIVAASANFQR
jgi:ribose transport system permease protein